MYALALGLDMDAAVEKLAGALGVDLESNNPGGAGEAQGIDAFRFVEVGHFTLAEGEEQELKPASIKLGDKEGEGRGVIIPVERLEEFAKQHGSDVFSSHFCYNLDDKSQIDALAEEGKLVLLGDYYAVFKAISSAEIVHAINQASDLIERLKQKYDVPFDAVAIYYANRSIQVQVDYTVFGIEPTLNLHEIYRRMTCSIIGVDPLKPEHSTAFSQIDLSVYRHDYLANILGTQVSTGGGRSIYKIRMSYAAFKKMSYQRLHEFSLRRPDLPERERWPRLSAKSRDFFNSVFTSIQRDTIIDEGDTIASLFYRPVEERAGISTLKQLAPTLLRRLFDESRQALATPSKHLNSALAGGLHPGNLYLIAGFPGSGTSSMALQILNHAAAQQDAQCFYVALQRGVEEIFKRGLAFLGKIPISEIDEKRQSPADLYEDKDFNKRIFAAYERYQQFAENITILEGEAAASLSMLAQLVRDKREQLKLSGNGKGHILLVIDSLQLMVAMMRARWAERHLGGEGEAAAEISQWDVETLTSRLKALARELDITVVATMEHYAQHNVFAGEQGEEDSMLQQLFLDTQFADTVMLLSRQGDSLQNLRDYFKGVLTGTPHEPRIKPLEEKLLKLESDYRKTKEFKARGSEFAVLELIKNRSGPRDKILFVYHKPLSSFEPLEYLD